MGEAMIVRKGGGGKITAIERIITSSYTAGASGVAGKRIWYNLDLNKTYIFHAWVYSVTNDNVYEHSAVIRKGEIIDEYDGYYDEYADHNYMNLTLNGTTLTAKTYYANCLINALEHVLLEVTLG